MPTNGDGSSPSRTVTSLATRYGSGILDNPQNVKHQMPGMFVGQTNNSGSELTRSQIASGITGILTLSRDVPGYVICDTCSAYI